MKMAYVVSYSNSLLSTNWKEEVFFEEEKAYGRFHELNKKKGIFTLPVEERETEEYTVMFFNPGSEEKEEIDSFFSEEEAWSYVDQLDAETGYRYDYWVESK